MTALEKLMTELYDTLLHLRYPGIAQVTPEDIEGTIFGSENRLFLLSWLLTLSPVVPSEEFAKSTDGAKLVKWYSNMGICVNTDALLGKVPMRDQVPTLRHLLRFMKNVLIMDQTESCEKPQVTDIFQTHIGETINIIPPMCSLTSKLSYSEAMQYLKTRRRSLSELKISSTQEIIPVPMQKALSASEITSANGDNNSAASQEPDQEKGVEKFVEAFGSVSTWPRLKNDESTQAALRKSMNTHVQKIDSNLTLLKETLRSTEEISKFAVTGRLEEHAMPLDAVIEVIVIRLEEVNNLHIVG